jgi:hypothetical protein
MNREELLALSARLEERGIAVGELPSLAAELEVEEGGFVRRQMQRAADFMARQLSHARGEWSESEEAVLLITARLWGEELSAEEQERLWSQLADLARVVPAAAIALAAESLPMMGTAFITPYVLGRLGLLPSRWRDARLRDHLRREAERLRGVRADLEAAALEQLAEEVDCQRRLRLRAAEEAALLARWDRDGDGRWSPDERKAYEELVQALRADLQRTAPRPRWMLLAGEEVFGPMALSAIADLGDAPGMIVHLDGVEGWVRLVDLRDLLPAQPSSSQRRRPDRS